MNILGTLAVLGMLSFFSPCNVLQKEPNYTKISGSIIENTSKKLIKRHSSMRLIGTGGGFMNCVNMLSMSFEVDYPLSKNEARKILIDCTEEFLKDINENEKIKPFLVTYPKPFTIKQIEIMIFSTNPDGSWVYDPYITVSSCTGGIVEFDTKDPNQKYGYKNEYEETYDEALKIVRSEMKS